MCDTFVHMPHGSGGPVIFGKNSDREPNEAQQIVRIPRQRRPSGRVRATFIEVDSAVETQAVILSKPFQMWGAEMGVNESGVAIGNEALFTRVPIDRRNNGLTGMDLLRLALEASYTAQEALQTIIRYLEAFGQDACGGYLNRKFFYHNSFLIADAGQAFVLETAGRHWAWKQVSGYRAISNGLSIGGDFDQISDGAVDYAVKRRWASAGEFNFRQAFSAFWMPRLAACDARRRLSETLGGNLPAGNEARAFDILRSHAVQDFDPASAKTDSLCMHASGMLCPSQTTGSMVAVLRSGAPPTVWLTGSSAPCLSLYKPFYADSEVLDASHFQAPGAGWGDAYWWRWEAFHRKALPVYNEIIGEVRRVQAETEARWLAREASAQEPADRDALSRECLTESLQVLDRWMELAGKASPRQPWLYRRFWKARDRELRRIASTTR